MTKTNAGIFLTVCLAVLVLACTHGVGRSIEILVEAEPAEKIARAQRVLTALENSDWRSKIRVQFPDVSEAQLESLQIKVRKETRLITFGGEEPSPATKVFFDCQIDQSPPEERTNKILEYCMQLIGLEFEVQLSEQGNAKSQYNLGVMYERGLGVTRDYQEAVRWYHLAAEQGFARAQYNLGGMHEKGLGVTRDYQEAVRWYRLAADQGLAMAQNNLGGMHKRGLGVSRDYQEAVRWYRLAADQGLAMAQYNLGGMYFNGYGVGRNYLQAYMWTTLAAEQGLELAVKPKDFLEKKMTPEQIAEAQRLAREWKPKGKG